MSDGSFLTTPQSNRITAIRPLKQPRGFVSIRSGTAVIARLHPAELAELALRIDDVITPDLETRIRTAEARTAARHDADRIIRRRAVSERQLRESLVAAGHSTDITDQVVAAYVVSGAIDDARLAESAAHQSLARGRSRVAAAAALHNRGLDAETAWQAMRQAGEGHGSEFERALKLVQARQRPSLLAQPAHVQRRRLASVLARRGFDESTIESVLAAAVGKSDGD